MATLETQIECDVCREEFNSSRRPKVIKCGHSFCGNCLQQYIDTGSKCCPICREPHNVSSAEDFPVNTGMEKVLEKLSEMTSPMMTYKNVKVHTLHEAQQNLVDIKSAKTTLECIVSEKNETIDNKEAMIQSLQKELDDDKQVIDKAKEGLSETNNIQSQLQYSIEELQTETETKAILQGCAELHTKMENLSMDFKEVKQKHYLDCTEELLLKDPKQALLILRNSPYDIYAVENKDQSTLRASKVERTDGLLRIPSLEKDVIPTQGSYILSVSSLLMAAGTNPVVCLGLSQYKIDLGMIKIRLTCGPIIMENMLHLCTAYKGKSLKVMGFDSAYEVGCPGEAISCIGYMDSGNYKRNCRIFNKQGGGEFGKCKELEKGAVTCYNSGGFEICTETDHESTEMRIEIGRVISGLDLLSRAMEHIESNKQDNDDGVSSDDERFGGYSRVFDANSIKICYTGVELFNDQTYDT